MRPTRLVLTLAAVLLLVPVSVFGAKGTFPDDEYFYQDKASGEKIKTHANVDQVYDEFCFAGLTVFIDSTTTLNRRVEFLFESLGSIGKQSSSKVSGVFDLVDLTINIYDGPETTNTILFTSTLLDAPCDLDATLSKGGAKLKGSLDCSLGTNLGAFGAIDSDLLLSVGFAHNKKKSIKVDVPKGRLRIKTSGVEVDPVADQIDFSRVPCETSSDQEED
jgi:hypothetical protein